MLMPYEAWAVELDRVAETWRVALEEGDRMTLASILLKAAVFAACTAHTTVDQAEREYTEWVETGHLPVDGTNLQEQKASAAITAEEWAFNVLTLDDYRSFDGWSLAEGLKANVYGLGTAKASFAAALAGFPEPYCLDTHALQKVQRVLRPDLTLDQLRGRARRWAFYREVGDAVFGDRWHQWHYFEEVVPEFAAGGHAAYFVTV